MANFDAISGKFFIVPKKYFVITEDKISSLVMSYHNNLVKDLFLPDDFLLMIGDRPIGIQTTWDVHQEEKEAEFQIHIEQHRFISMLPERVIKDLREGDPLEFQMFGAPMSLMAKQLGSSYESFGTFQDTLKIIS